MWLDPLIEKLSSEDFKPFGYWWDVNDGVTAQGYEDDLLLFARSYDDMMELVKIVQGFIREHNIQQNPKMCEMPKISKNPHKTFPFTDGSTGEIELLNYIDNKKVIRYIGAPLGKGKISLMK
jgi:hypothetical protein